MLPPLVLFWLAAPGSADPHGELERWAADHGYRPVPALQVSGTRYDADLVQEIETLLEEVRSRAPGSLGNFARLDQLLAAHPELPQAAWWAAERYALEVQLRARDGERDAAVERALTRAGSALEGRRAPVAGAGAGTPEEPVQRLSLQLLDQRPHDELLLDGQSVDAGAAIVPGRHQAQLFRAQRLVWSGWVELGSPPVLHVADPSPACSDPDFWGTRDGARGPVALPGVRCGAWAVANLRGNEIELAFCRASRCGDWERRSLAGGSPTATADASSSVPPWITWGAIGLGAAASTMLVLWQTGVFDRPAPATQFVFTGPTAAAVRF